MFIETTITLTRNTRICFHVLYDHLLIFIWAMFDFIAVIETHVTTCMQATLGFSLVSIWSVSRHASDVRIPSYIIWLPWKNLHGHFAHSLLKWSWLLAGLDRELDQAVGLDKSGPSAWGTRRSGVVSIHGLYNYVYFACLLFHLQRKLSNRACTYVSVNFYLSYAYD